MLARFPGRHALSDFHSKFSQLAGTGDAGVAFARRITPTLEAAILEATRSSKYEVIVTVDFKHLKPIDWQSLKETLEDHFGDRFSFHLGLTSPGRIPPPNYVSNSWIMARWR
jgi:hypothetical protein